MRKHLEIKRCRKNRNKTRRLFRKTGGIANADVQSMFERYCATGDLTNAKKMYSENADMEISNIVFGSTCVNGHLEVAKWLWSIKPTIIVSINNDYTFSATCANGHLEVAKWLLSIKPTIDVSANNEYAFSATCKKGHLEVAKWLLSIKPTINVSIRNDEVFYVACKNGQFGVAKWLWSIKPSIDVSAIDERAFRETCANGHLEVAKWLWSIKPSIDISIDKEYAFRTACVNGHLEVVKWLLSIKPSIDVGASNEHAFYLACSNDRSNIVDFFTSTINPSKYSSKIVNGEMECRIKTTPKPPKIPQPINILPSSLNFEITEATQAFDPIMFEDEPLLEFLKKDTNNIVVFNHDKFYAIDKKNVIPSIDLENPGNSIVFECLEEGTLRPTNIVSDNPLAKVSLFGIPEENKYVSAGKISNMLNGPNKIFVLVQENARILKSVVSDSILNHQGQHISGSHCQAGQGGQLYDIQSIQMPQVAGRRRTIRRNAATKKSRRRRVCKTKKCKLSA